jgi:hypothetical protein
MSPYSSPRRARTARVAILLRCRMMFSAHESLRALNWAAWKRPLHQWEFSGAAVVTRRRPAAGHRQAICVLLALLAFVAVGGCSASGPEPGLETAFSAIGIQVKVCTHSTAVASMMVRRG